MKQLVTALQEISNLAPERRHAKAPRGDALARQRIGEIARAALAMTIRPAGERARRYSVEIMATNRTVLIRRGSVPAHNRLHALVMVLAELGYRQDIATATISKVGKVEGERARQGGERAAFNADMRAYVAQRREDDQISDRISDKVIVQRAPCETN